jgi:hypothetical protein
VLADTRHERAKIACFGFRFGGECDVADGDFCALVLIPQRADGAFTDRGMRV